MTPTAATELAESVLADGFGAHRTELAALFAGARRRGVNPVLVAVAADPTAPVIARQRALGRVIIEYGRLAAETLETLETSEVSEASPASESGAPVARALAASAAASAA